jgi:hypothetical protein
MIQSHRSESREKSSPQLKITGSYSLQFLYQLAFLAILGQVILLASALLLPIVSEYSLVGDNISELALGPHGFIQTGAFLIAVPGTLGLAFALRHFTNGAWGALVGSLLVGTYGLGSILAAIFPTDRIDTAVDVWAQSTTGMIHMFMDLISFLGMIIGMFLLTRTLGLLPAWRPIMRLSVLFPADALALFIVRVRDC